MTEHARFLMPMSNGMTLRFVATDLGLSINLLNDGEVIDVVALFPDTIYCNYFSVCTDCGCEYSDPEEGCDLCSEDPRKMKMPISGNQVESLIHDYSEDFLLGYNEARGDCETTYGDPQSDRSLAYTLGRTLGRGLLQLD
jgi:hypothetical protein